ncbi:hypothetical protein D3C71_1321870 [compost metagenome]
MRVGFQGAVTDLSQQRPEVGIAGKTGPQGQHVDEEADQVFGLGMGASRNGGADNDIVLSAPP